MDGMSDKSREQDNAALLRELIAEQKRTNELLAALLAQSKTAVALSVVS
jgi:hypothetical protein